MQIKVHRLYIVLLIIVKHHLGVLQLSGVDHLTTSSAGGTSSYDGSTTWARMSQDDCSSASIEMLKSELLMRIPTHRSIGADWLLRSLQDIVLCLDRSSRKPLVDLMFEILEECSVSLYPSGQVQCYIARSDLLHSSTYHVRRVMNNLLHSVVNRPSRPAIMPQRGN